MYWLNWINTKPNDQRLFCFILKTLYIKLNQWLSFIVRLDYINILNKEFFLWFLFQTAKFIDKFNEIPPFNHSFFIWLFCTFVITFDIKKNPNLKYQIEFIWLYCSCIMNWILFEWFVHFQGKKWFRCND